MHSKAEQKHLNGTEVLKPRAAVLNLSVLFMYLCIYVCFAKGFDLWDDKDLTYQN